MADATASTIRYQFTESQVWKETPVHQDYCTNLATRWKLLLSRLRLRFFFVLVMHGAKSRYLVNIHVLYHAVGIWNERFTVEWWYWCVFKLNQVKSLKVKNKSKCNQYIFGIVQCGREKSLHLPLHLYSVWSNHFGVEVLFLRSLLPP